MKPLTMTQDLLDAAHGTQLGRSIEVRAGEPAETLIRVAGPDQRSQMLTVTMALERVAPPGVGRRAVAAVLRWGSGGAQQEAEADWLHGAVVSVPGSYLEVLARNEGKLPVRVSAVMGYGSRPGSSTLQRTVAYGSLSTNTAVTLAIPAWAVSGVVLFDDGVTQLDLVVKDFEGDPMLGGDSVPIGLQLPLPNGAASVTLEATTGAGNAYIVYALSL